jgi:hypothetical protein
MRTRSLLIAVVVCMLALGAAPTAGANEAENALVNICNVRGTPNPDVFPGVFFCNQEGFSSDSVLDTAELASMGYLAPEKVCEAAGGSFGLLGRSTSGGSLFIIGWGCRLVP